MRFRDRLLSPEFWLGLCLLSMLVGVILGLTGHWPIGRWLFLPVLVGVAVICFVFIPILVFHNRKLHEK
jgi:antibiotic biosynthesis monooxygenase (ABM) superfamily enzyme